MLPPWFRGRRRPSSGRLPWRILLVTLTALLCATGVALAAHPGSGDRHGGTVRDAAYGSPPDTRITSGPADGSLANSRSARFTFDSDTGDSFLCKLDDTASRSCNEGSVTYSDLGDGFHRFTVTALRSGVPDPTPATRTWAVDATPPDTVIDGGPPASGLQAAATLSFHSSEAASTFRCQLDSGALLNCASPLHTAALAVGAHTFAVRAVDRAGNIDASPALRSWTVTAPKKTSKCDKVKGKQKRASCRHLEKALATCHKLKGKHKRSVCAKRARALHHCASVKAGKKRKACVKKAKAIGHKKHHKPKHHHKHKKKGRPGSR